MKILNIGILAHVDAGKTTLTESLLYASGAIAKPGSVDSGTTHTDTMELERQRGITIQTAVTSFRWRDCKINLVDTPGHMDFVAEVYRSLAVLDGAVLVVSARDGVQAQTRVLFYALQKMGIPTVIFVNKIDQPGIDLGTVRQSIRDKLDIGILVKQKVVFSPLPTLLAEEPSENRDTLISGSDSLLKQYLAGKEITRKELDEEELRRVRNASLCPVYHGSAKNHIGTRELMEAIVRLFAPSTSREPDTLCASVFKVEYTAWRQRLVYLRLYSGQIHLRDHICVDGKRNKITDLRVADQGKIVQADIAYAGEIAIIPHENLQINNILGNEELLPRKPWAGGAIPMLRAVVAPKDPARRAAMLDALTEIADTDPLLGYEVDDTTREITLSFLGQVQMEVFCALLEDKYKIPVTIEKSTVIYLERPLGKAEYTIHVDVPPNPFVASVGLIVEPLPMGTGNQYESHVPLGYLSQGFQNAVADGVRYGLEQGVYGWQVTDCKVCLEYALYYSAGSTPADFRKLAPVVVEQALKKAGTQLLEPMLNLTVYAPQSYLARAYRDAPKYQLHIDTMQMQKDEVVLTGDLPARTVQEYRRDLARYTAGKGVCLTELKGYQPTVGEPMVRARRPNERIDKFRHMLDKGNEGI